MADFPGQQGFKRSYCATVEELADLVDTLHKTYDNVGICWDFGHANLVYSNQVPCLNYLASRIKVTHVHDNMGLEDEHRAPFLGNVKWDKIMPALAHCGYEGNFSFEGKTSCGGRAGAHQGCVLEVHEDDGGISAVDGKIRFVNKKKNERGRIGRFVLFF